MMIMQVRSIAAIIFPILIIGCAPYPYAHGHHSNDYGYSVRPAPYGNYGNRSYQQYQPHREHHESRDRDHEHRERGYGQHRGHD